jgi:hypothetical protein
MPCPGTAVINHQHCMLLQRHFLLGSEPAVGMFWNMQGRRGTGLLHYSIEAVLQLCCTETAMNMCLVYLRVLRPA